MGHTPGEVIANFLSILDSVEKERPRVGYHIPTTRNDYPPEEGTRFATIKSMVGANWDAPLARTIVTRDGKRLRTLREAAAFVVEQDAKRRVWLSVTQVLIIASLDPNAVESATIAVENAIREQSTDTSERREKR